MAKKRTSLDTLHLHPPMPATDVEREPSPPPPSPAPAEKRVRRQTAYLPSPVHEQLRRLAFEERAKMHDYLIEGLDLVFKKRGLPSMAELMAQE